MLKQKISKTVFLIISIRLFLFVTGVQDLYKIIPDHCEVKNVNRSLVDLKIGKCYKLSRTELYLNASGTLLQDITNDQMGQVKITGYQFRSNEYRKGPVEFMMGACSAIRSKQFDIPNMLRYSNVKCPIKKGVNYYLYKLSPNATNMPPLIPEGKWKLQLDFMYLNKYIVATLEWYYEIEYFVKIG